VTTKGKPRGNARGSGYARNAHDWYVEPPHAVRALLDAEPIEGRVWDPACGRGTIPRVIEERGIDGFGTDLVDRGFGGGGIDFMRHSPPLMDNIICNPPYKIINAWIDRALKLTTRKVAIFAPLTFLEGIKRGAWFPTTPLSRVLVFSWRVNCPSGELAPDFDAPIEAWDKGTSKAYAWFIWDHAHAGEARVGFLRPPQRQAERLPLAA
jgi:hypothetical protein